MTVHGSFGRFLRRLCLQKSRGCYHCGVDGRGSVEGTALYTLVYCPAYASQYREMVSAAGTIVSSLPLMVLTMQSEESRNSLALFYEQVMLIKDVRRGKGNAEILSPTEEPSVGGCETTSGHPKLRLLYVCLWWSVHTYSHAHVCFTYVF